MKAEASNQKIAWFQRESETKTLDLSPEFQRNPVWTDEQAAYLVDTVLSGLPFPEVYLRSKTDAAGKTKHEVVDGQQRIRSLLMFAANDLELDGDEISPALAGKAFDNLTKKQKENFWNYTVVVRDLGNASNAEIRDLFRRLNKNSVVLNAQELRNARFKGRFITLMEELAEDEWWIESRIVTPRQVRRMEDIEFVSELFIGLMAGPQNKKDTIDDYYEALEKEFSDGPKYAKQFRDTRALILDILDKEALHDWSGKSDFYTLFLTMSAFSQSTLTAGQKTAVRERLRVFRGRVDTAKQKDAAGSAEPTVRKYVDAVTRAASDIDRRETRIKIVSKIVEDAITSSNQSPSSR